ncbi:hypothetical protein FRC03_002180 [Tulasnella sp. 419]|nr:hypothetical protein FRC03_002180 [Tulasnella sp. 419]
MLEDELGQCVSGLKSLEYLEIDYCPDAEGIINALGSKLPDGSWTCTMLTKLSILNSEYSLGGEIQMLQERYGSNPSPNESRPMPLSSLKLNVRKTNSDKVSDSEWLEHVGEDRFEMMKEKRTEAIDHRRAPLEGSELV